jgi:hypothetical protein
MATPEPTYSTQALWQLPWLRLSLIARRMVRDVDARDDLEAILALRRSVAQKGWFN